MKPGKKYCLECARKLRPEKPTSDFGGFIDAQQASLKQYPVVLCNGCGMIKVDHNGKRIGAV